MNRQATDKEKIFAIPVFEKRFVSRIHIYTYKEYMQLNTKKTAQIKKWAKNLNRHFTKEAVCVIDTDKCSQRYS